MRFNALTNDGYAAGLLRFLHGAQDEIVKVKQSSVDTQVYHQSYPHRIIRNKCYQL
jgi:hypothetical protein